MNKHLMPDNSPIANNQGQVNPFMFDYQNEAGVISNAKIRKASIGTAQIGTISFNNISGGTATLGGLGNGDGLLTVNDAGGGEVVRLDNTGIIITAGTINNVSVGTVSITGGSVNNTSLGTSQMIGGTVNNAVIGTPSITGGILNPSTYQIQGTTGATGTIVYLNSGTLLGTIIVHSGLITSIV